MTTTEGTQAGACPSAERIARELNLRWAHWDLIGRWQWTTADGITFYTAVGASRGQVADRLREKLVEFGQWPSTALAVT